MVREIRIDIDARGYRGFVYKGAAEVVRALFERDPLAAAEAARGRLIWLAPVAPHIRRWLAVPPEVEQALRVSREGERRSWSQRVAHGLVDFVLDASAALPTPARIAVRNLGDEPLDLEFFRILQRRSDPARLALELTEDREPPPPPAEKAEQFADRARRAMDLACYDAALDWAALAETVAGGRPTGRLRARIAHERLFALLLLDRLDELDALCSRLLREETDPVIRVDAGYVQAILYARFYARDRRDYRAARACVEAAIDTAANMPPGELRAVNTAFLHNTLALVELREGKPDLAGRLLTDAIAYLDREAPQCFAREATILFRNRARVHAHQGRPDAALDDLRRLHDLEPSNPEAWFDRALIHHKAGRPAEALGDYDRALFWAPPQVEALHNRAQCLLTLGRLREASAACGRVLEIDPDHLAARIDRACLSQTLGDRETMAGDVAHGLRRAPDDARLLCLSGVLAMLERRDDAALAAFNAALARQPELADAWANRAIVYVRRGEPEQALADLDRALALRDDPQIRRNRQRLLEKVRAQAIAPQGVPSG